MKNFFFKYSKIIIFLFILILSSCKEKERAEYNEIGQIDLESLACDSIKDISDAFPRIEKYKGYKLRQVDCTSNYRIYDLIYFDKDSLSKMNITIRDVRRPINDVYLRLAKDDFKYAIKNERVKKSSLKGEYATVHFNSVFSDTLDTSSFTCILKKNYAVHIQINKNKSLTNQDSLESFLKDYVNKIDISKLK